MRSPSQEANSYSTSKEFPHLLGIQRFITMLTRAHRSILSHMNPVHTLILSLRYMSIPSSHLEYGNTSEVVSFLQVFLDKFCTYSHLYHASLLLLIILIIFCDEYKLWSLPLCYLLFPLPKVQILSSAPVLTHPNLHLPLGWETKFHPYNDRWSYHLEWMYICLSV
jgi:hypothetical protein